MSPVCDSDIHDSNRVRSQQQGFWLAHLFSYDGKPYLSFPPNDRTVGLLCVNDVEGATTLGMQVPIG